MYEWLKNILIFVDRKLVYNSYISCVFIILRIHKHQALKVANMHKGIQQQLIVDGQTLKNINLFGSTYS